MRRGRRVSAGGRIRERRGICLGDRLYKGWSERSGMFGCRIERGGSCESNYCQREKCQDPGLFRNELHKRACGRGCPQQQRAEDQYESQDAGNHPVGSQSMPQVGEKGDQHQAVQPRAVFSQASSSSCFSPRNLCCSALLLSHSISYFFLISFWILRGRRVGLRALKIW